MDYVISLTDRGISRNIAWATDRERNSALMECAMNHVGINCDIAEIHFTDGSSIKVQPDEVL